MDKKCAFSALAPLLPLPLLVDVSSFLYVHTQHPSPSPLSPLSPLLLILLPRLLPLLLSSYVSISAFSPTLSPFALLLSYSSFPHALSPDSDPAAAVISG